MAQIRSGGNTETEIRLIRFFRQHGITGWRRKQVPFGRPDFVFPLLRVAMFVDGCFWHGCQLHGRVPTSNSDYWLPKIARNRSRDKEVTRTLQKNGWRVLRIWDHELAVKNTQQLLKRVRFALIVSKSDLPPEKAHTLRVSFPVQGARRTHSQRVRFFGRKVKRTNHATGHGKKNRPTLSTTKVANYRAGPSDALVRSEVFKVSDCHLRNKSR